MIDGSESAELRALQQKAYGRDGALTESDAARLTELEQQRAARNRPPHAGTTDGSTGDEAKRPSTERIDADTLSAEPLDTATSSSDEVEISDRLTASAPGLRQSVRRHWKTVAAASVAVLMIGIGAGWALSPRAEGLALTAQQQERRAELQTGGQYDPGSVHAIGRDGSALVWYGTKKDGAMACLVLDVGEQSAGGCQQGTDVNHGFGVGLQVGEGDTAEQISASAAQSTSGEIVAVIQRWEAGAGAYVSQFSGGERTRAEELVADGFEQYTVSIVGYFGGDPVWHATRFDEVSAVECLLVDVIGAIHCIPQEEALTPGVSIVIDGASVDTIDGGSEPWSIALDFTSTGSTYLTIRGGSTEERSSVESGSYIEYGGEYGDRILVDVPDDSAPGS